jgi:hypothetical protein
MNKSGTGKDISKNKLESGKGMEIKDDKVDEIKAGALGRNPLGAINQTGLEGLIGSVDKNPGSKKSDTNLKC